MMTVTNHDDLIIYLYIVTYCNLSINKLAQQCCLVLPLVKCIEGLKVANEPLIILVKLADFAKFKVLPVLFDQSGQRARNLCLTGVGCRESLISC